MKVKKALFSNLLAGGWTKISIVLVRLVQVPLILLALGVEDYGRWLVLSSISTWLNLANIGFGDVAANEMPMAIAAGDFDKAKEVFSTTLALITAIGIIGVVLVFSIVPFIPIEHFLGVPGKRANEVSFAVIWLAVSIFISFYFDAFLGKFRSARKTHVSIVITSFFPWVDLLAVFITLQFTKRFDMLALSLLISIIVRVIIYSAISRRIMPGISFSINLVQIKRFKELFRKGLAFQAFPLGNALLFQGNLLIVQAILGPVAVTIFGTARTLVRTLNQAMELINQAMWPELTYLFGANDLVKAARLHRIGVGVSIIVSTLGVLFLIFFGQTLYGFWLGKSLKLSQHLLIFFLLPIPFNVFWFTSSVVHLATNKHEGLAKRYLIATSMSAVACAILSYLLGIEGAALSTLMADIVLIPFVLKRSLMLTNDTWPNFTSGLIQEFKIAPALLSKYSNIKK